MKVETVKNAKVQARYSACDPLLGAYYPTVGTSPVFAAAKVGSHVASLEKPVPKEHTATTKRNQTPDLPEFASNRPETPVTSPVQVSVDHSVSYSALLNEPCVRDLNGDRIRLIYLSP